MEGTSLRPAFAGQPLPQRPIFWEHEGNRAMRLGDYKLVAKGPGGKWELYDIPHYRTEMRDLAQHQPQRMREMVRAWEEWAGRCHVIPWPWKPQYQPMNGG